MTRFIPPANGRYPLRPDIFPITRWSLSDSGFNAGDGLQPFPGARNDLPGVRSFSQMEDNIQVILIVFPGYFSLKIEYPGERKKGFVQLGHR